MKKNIGMLLFLLSCCSVLGCGVRDVWVRAYICGCQNEILDINQEVLEGIAQCKGDPTQMQPIAKRALNRLESLYNEVHNDNLMPWGYKMALYEYTDSLRRLVNPTATYSAEALLAEQQREWKKNQAAALKLHQIALQEGVLFSEGNMISPPKYYTE